MARGAGCERLTARTAKQHGVAPAEREDRREERGELQRIEEAATSQYSRRVPVWCVLCCMREFTRRSGVFFFSFSLSLSRCFTSLSLFFGWRRLQVLLAARAIIWQQHGPRAFAFFRRAREIFSRYSPPASPSL